MEQDDVIKFLSDPESYGSMTAPVERQETHGAIVFLTGDYAYKLKRAVHFSYMDYSTPELRRAACEKEIAVNRRTAPTLYLGVKAIVRDTRNHLRFGESDDPAAIDWVVVMHRFAQSALLEAMRKQGTLSANIVKTLAEQIASFHASAEIVRNVGGAEGIRRVIAENSEILSSFCDAPFRKERIRAYKAAATDVWCIMSGELEKRRIAGFVRRCHGDIHLNNVCMIDGAPVLFDAIEFNDEFSSIDVFYDLAFLLMDLEHYHLRVLANVLLNRYLECTGDFDGLSVLPLFLSCRAAVRAHVWAAQAAITRERSLEADSEAEAYLADAIQFLVPVLPRLIVLGGVSGTGKSTVARALAPFIGRGPGAIVLRSDVLRKKLWSVEENIALPAAAYEGAVTRKVYDRLCDQARAILAAGRSVVADAVFGTEEERQAIVAVGRAAGVSCDALWLDAPLETLERRVANRRNDASDATVDVLRKQATAIASPTDWITIDAGGSPEQTLKSARGALRLGH